MPVNKDPSPTKLRQEFPVDVNSHGCQLDNLSKSLKNFCQLCHICLSLFPQLLEHIIRNCEVETVYLRFVDTETA